MTRLTINESNSKYEGNDYLQLLERIAVSLEGINKSLEELNKEGIIQVFCR